MMFSVPPLLLQQADHDWLLSEPKSASLNVEACTLTRIHRSSFSDLNGLSEWLLANPQHYRRLLRRPPSPKDAEDLFTVCPSGLSLNRKYVWRLCDEKRLLGCLEALRSWPEQDVLYIGFLMVDELWRRMGLATRCLELLSEGTLSWGNIRRWRLAVVETDAAALRFWIKSGFVPTGHSEYSPAYGARLVVLEKSVR